MSGIWHDIEPKGLSRRAARHDWLFATYMETPSDRNSAEWYYTLLFRNVDRTVFGARVWAGKNLPRVNPYNLAAKILRDEAYRKTLLSDDPAFPRLWKRH